MQPILIFFVTQPAPGLVKTGLCPALSPKEAADLYEAFLLDIFDRFARPVNIPTGARYALGLAIDAPQSREWFERTAPRDAKIFEQKGKTHSEKILNIFEDAAFEGFAQVGVVGTDNPTLAPAHVGALLSAVGVEINNSKITKIYDGAIGPDRRGGYWGIALTKPRPELFLNLTDANGKVALATMERAKASGIELYRGPVLSCIDTIEDLSSLASELKSLKTAATVPRTAALMERFGVM
ncbi:MAG: DUF2064 domain-containing protein [Planctomycetota bacterium]